MDPDSVSSSPKGELRGNWKGGFNPHDAAGRMTLYAALDSFQSYRSTARRDLTHRRRMKFYDMPLAHWNMLASPPFNVPDTFDALDAAIDRNADLTEAIFREVAPNVDINPDIIEPHHDPSSGEAMFPAWYNTATAADFHSVRTTLRQMHREWSAEGAAERRTCYEPVVAAIEAEHASTPHSDRSCVRVLVPGAGLGRLAIELHRCGFTVEANDMSYHQLLASAFILNHTVMADEFEISPFIHSCSNHVSRAHQLRRVSVPDVHPRDALRQPAADADDGPATPVPDRLVMTAGNFTSAYAGEAERGVFDAVATVFFIDTASNPVAYVETIANCLRSGGVWVNLGPLLWHFENDPPNVTDDRGGTPDMATNTGVDGGVENEARGNDTGRDGGPAVATDSGSVELTDDEMVALVEHYGFKIERRQLPSASMETGYTTDDASMLRQVYRPSFWIARKL